MIGKSEETQSLKSPQAIEIDVNEPAFMTDREEEKKPSNKKADDKEKIRYQESDKENKEASKNIINFSNEEENSKN